MNSITEHELLGEHILRDQLLDMLADQDLVYKLPGHNPTLGGLCEEMGQIEQVYIYSFKNFKMDWSYHEALLIFYAKASVFLKALEKTLPDQWKIGIG